MKYIFHIRALFSMVLFTILLLGVFTSAMAVNIYPFTFGGSHSSDSVQWRLLIKYKLWATGSDGIQIYGDVHIHDSTGYTGSAKGGLTFYQDIHSLGGPLLFKGSFKNETGKDSILHGPSRFNDGMNVAFNGRDSNVFRGEYCTGNGSLGDNFNYALEKGSYGCGNTLPVDDKLDIPKLVTNVSYDKRIEEINLQETRGAYYIDVPETTSRDIPYVIFVEGNIILENHASLYIRLPSAGRFTRIVVGGLIKLTNDSEIRVIYADPSENWQTQKAWKRTREKAASIKEYSGDLLFYTTEDFFIPAGNYQGSDKNQYKILQGSFISTGTIQIAQGMNFGGQLLAKKLVIEHHFLGDFDYKPHDNVFSAEALVNAQFKEGEDDRKGLQPLHFALKEPSTVDVSFKYCIEIDASADPNAKRGSNPDEVSFASREDFVGLSDGILCNGDKNFERVEIKMNEKSPDLQYSLKINDDILMENKEAFRIRIFDLVGATFDKQIGQDQMFTLFIVDNDNIMPETHDYPFDYTITENNDTLGFEDVEFPIDSFPAYYHTDDGKGGQVEKNLSVYNVIVKSLPKDTLKYKGKIVKVGDVIPSDSLKKGLLRYHNLLNHYGDTTSAKDFLYDSLTFAIELNGRVSEVASMKIKIKAMNDKPEFVYLNSQVPGATSRGYIQGNKFSVPDDAAKDSIIGYAMAIDTADSRYAPVTLKYSLGSPDAEMVKLGGADITGAFEIDPVSGAIKVKKLLDYDIASTYHGYVIVTDNGVPGNRSDKDFLKDSIAVHVALTKAPPKTIDIVVRDTTYGEGDNKKYIGYEDIAFPIDSFPAYKRLVVEETKNGKGEVISRKIIESELLEKYSVVIKSLSKGILMYNGTTVKEMWDEKLSSPVTVSSDDLKNGLLMFQGAQDEYGDSAGGYIYADMTFEIIREGATAPSETRTMKITVKPINDKPQAKDEYGVFVMDSVKHGYRVHTVGGRDPYDAFYDTKAEHTFSFIQENFAGTFWAPMGSQNLWKDFELDPRTGVITVREGVELKYYQDSIYYGQVVVTDNGVPGNRTDVLKDTAEIAIYLMDAPKKPEIENIPDTVVLEHSAVKTPVIGFKASDHNAQDSLFFSLVSGDEGKFELIGVNRAGVPHYGDSAFIQVKSDIDYETLKKDYVITIAVSDSKDKLTALSDTKSFTIKVRDVNEVPFFVDAGGNRVLEYSYQLANMEGHTIQVGDSVGKAYGKDLDVLAKPMTELTYQLVSIFEKTSAGEKVAPGQFAIDASTGKITIAKDPQLETDKPKVFRAVISVTDNGEAQTFFKGFGKEDGKLGSANLSSTINAIISLTQSNIPVVIEPETLDFSVKENSEGGTFVGAVKAVDPDEDHKLVFTIDEDVPFTLKPTKNLDSVDIVVKDYALIDFETQKQYTFKVYVSDGLTRDSCDITVNVLDINEQPDVTGMMIASVKENTKPGTFVAKIEAFDVDTWTASMNFKLLDMEAGDNYAQYFNVVPVSEGCTSFDGDTRKIFCVNIVTSNVNINYETLANTSFRFWIVATDDGDSYESGAKYGASLSDSGFVGIYVLDDNDSVKFDGGPFEFSIAENSPVDTYIDRLTIKDEDTQQTHTFEFIPGGADDVSEVFKVDEYGSIYVKKAVLDFETKKKYSFRVRVTDSGDPATHADTTVVINVTDVNEKPDIADIAKEIQVAENTAKGTVVVPIKVSDVDTWTESMSYTLIVTNHSGKTVDFFEAVSTGKCEKDFCANVVTTAKNLNYEELAKTGDAIMTACMIATDDGKNKGYPPSLSDTVCTTIMVTDGNDSVKFDGGPFEFSVKENSAVGDSVGKLKIKDEDAKQTHSFTIINDGSGTDKIFSIDGGGKITVAKAVLDFETKKLYSFRVRVTDSGDPATYADTAVVINVLDINEKPAIDPIPEKIQVAEHSAVGGVIGSVKVSDVDTWTTKMTYTLAVTDHSGKSLAFFELVNAATCETGYFCRSIAIKDNSFNYEELLKTRDTKLNARIIATDDGNDFDGGKTYGASLSDTVFTIIEITDANDSVKFDADPFNINVKENTEKGKIIKVLSITDEDVGQSYTFEIVEEKGNEATEIFSVDNFGYVYVAKAVLDYEAKNQYSFKVRVTDNGVPQMSDETTVNVNVTDVNEDPTFKDMTLEVVELTDIGKALGTLISGDVDKDPKFMVHEFYAVGGDTALFALSTKGVVSVKSEIYDEALAIDNYLLKIRVDDVSEKTPVLRTPGNVIIKLLHINHPPHVYDSTFHVKENSPEGTVVGKVGATDDSTTYENLKFEIVGGSNEFAISVSEHGQITVKADATLDYESKKEYDIKVRATDKGGKSAEGAIKVKVDDVNDAPTLDDVTYSIAENSPEGFEVGVLKGKDQDNTAAELAYAIVGTSNEFAVAKNGQITVKKGAVLDYETKNRFTFKATVTDPDGLSATATVTVMLTNVNEPPVFGKNEFSISENSPAGTKVDVLVAHDPEDADDKLVYALLEQSNEFVVAKNGLITVKKGAILDYETTKEYTLKVSVTDTKSATTKGTAKIYITDLREPPTIRDTILYVPENVPVGTTVGTIIPNNPENDKVTFTFLTDTDKFKIKEDGTIVTKGDIDYEKEKYYTLKVRLTAEDGSTSDATVTIYVINELEIPKVRITRAESDGDVWPNPEIIYTNKYKFDFEWTVDGKMRPDTLVDFKKDGTHEFTLCYTDPTMDEPGCDTVIVKIDNSIPTVSIAKEKEEQTEITGVTIEEPNPDETKFYVNHEENEVVVSIKDKASDIDTKFKVGLSLNPLTSTKKALDQIKKIAETEIALDDAEDATTKRTKIGDKLYEVSFVKEVGDKEVVVTYTADEKGKIVKNADGDAVMKVSYETEIDGKPATVSYNVDGKTGDVIENENGGLYEFSYSYVDKYDGVVGVRYSVDEKGNFVKTEAGDLGYEVSYTYKNRYGNEATKTITVIVDKIVPKVKIVSPVNKLIVHTNGVDVKWTVDGEVQDTLVIQNLNKGLNKIIRTYRDKAGNEASDTVSVIMKDVKELNIHVEKPVTIVSADSVLKYYGDNPPEKGQAYAVSLYNVKTKQEVETSIGGTFGKKEGSNKEVYPGMDGHLGPTLLFDALAPRCGEKTAAGLCTLDDMVERDGLISLDAGGGRDRKKVSVEEYVEKYCSSEFRKEYKGDQTKANLYKTTLHVTIWIYTNLGGYLDHYTFTQEVNDPEYVSEVGDVKMAFELKPNLDGDVVSAKGRLFGTSAYIYNAEVKSVTELRCKLPDEDIGKKHYATDDLQRTFGYKRPDPKKMERRK